MLSRLAARVVTGPLAFFVAGVVDVVALWSAWAAQSAARAVRRRMGRGPRRAER
jgi:hypothetical protein